MISVDVVVPVHGHWDLTERCLETLRSRDACVRTVIVVDDASGDDTAARLGERDDVVPVILERNGGFSAACNAGARRATADAVLFLNNDTLVPPGAIARLARELSDDATIGAAGPRLLYADGTVQSAGGTLAASTGETARAFLHLDGDAPQVNVPGDYIALTGAALLVRREAYLAVGGFDEVYRNGFEDVDLGMKLWTAGWRVRYVPEAAIVHLEGASRGRAHDEEANRGVFGHRWAPYLDAIPRFVLPDPPCLLVAWKNRAPVDVLVRDHVAATLRRYAGARATFGRTPFARTYAAIAAALDRRALLRIAYADAGPRDVTWIAPRDAADARAHHVPPDGPVWVPSQRAKRFAIDAGVDPRRIAIVHLGFAGVEPAARFDRVIVITSRDAPPARLHGRARLSSTRMRRMTPRATRCAPPARSCSRAPVTHGDCSAAKRSRLVRSSSLPSTRRFWNTCRATRSPARRAPTPSPTSQPRCAPIPTPSPPADRARDASSCAGSRTSTPDTACGSSRAPSSTASPTRTQWRSRRRSRAHCATVRLRDENSRRRRASRA